MLLFNHLLGWRMSSAQWSSFLSHTSNINDLLESLDGVLKYWLNGLHDTESSFHIVNLWLHSFDGLHLSSNLNEWLSIIKSLKDSGGKSFLDVLDGSGLCNGGITITSSFGWEGWSKGWFKVDEELIFVHVWELAGSSSGDKEWEFHLKCDKFYYYKLFIINFYRTVFIIKFNEL